jgi:hypothetical protein
MICELCSSEDNTLDDRLGERVCDDCGYVMVAHLYEDTTTQAIEGTEDIRAGDRGILGSDIGYQTHGAGNAKLVRSLRRNQQRLRDRATQNMGKGILECNMILSPWLPNSNLKDRVHAYYKRFFQDRHTWRWTVGTRATALVYLVLKENGIAISISEISEKNAENRHKVSKAARYFARGINKPWLLNQMAVHNWVEKCGNTLVHIHGPRYSYNEEMKQEFLYNARVISDYIYQQIEGRDMTFTKSHLACCFWITCLLRTKGSWPEYTQGEICHSCGCAEISLRDNMRRLYVMLNTNKKDLKRMQIEQFISGVRYG